MKRRSFLTLLGLSPVVARAAPAQGVEHLFNTQSDYRTMNDGLNDELAREYRKLMIMTTSANGSHSHPSLQKGKPAK